MKILSLFVLRIIVAFAAPLENSNSNNTNPSISDHASPLVFDSAIGLNPEIAKSLDTTHSDFGLPPSSDHKPPTTINHISDHFLENAADDSPNDHLIEIMQDHVDETEWLVPQLDGSLKLMTEKEAEFEMRSDVWLGKSKPIVIFNLYTQLHQPIPHVLTINDTASLARSNFNPKIPTRFIIHGWQNNNESPVNLQIKKSLLSTGKYNVICVDWSDKADNIIYPLSVQNVVPVGKIVAEMIDFLHNKGKLSLADLTVIGHSLGAHVAGFAGKHVTVGKIHTIIGLDVAKPLFKYNNINERLHESDAVYVESIHTCGDLLGFLQPIGKVAFYPNGGKSQPGCGIDLTGSCAHSRSFVYYAESILRKGFMSIMCPNYQKAVKKSCGPNSALGVMLGNKDNEHAVRGTYYTPINKKAPFGLLLLPK